MCRDWRHTIQATFHFIYRVMLRSFYAIHSSAFHSLNVAPITGREKLLSFLIFLYFLIPNKTTFILLAWLQGIDRELFKQFPVDLRQRKVGGPCSKGTMAQCKSVAETIHLEVVRILFVKRKLLVKHQSNIRS